MINTHRDRENIMNLNPPWTHMKSTIFNNQHKTLHRDRTPLSTLIDQPPDAT